MTFATSAVVMGQIAAAEAAATAAAMAAAAGGASTAAAAATSGLPAAATQQTLAQQAGAALTSAPTAASTTAGGIQGANLANIAGNTMTDAGASLMGPSGGPIALPSAPAVPEVAAAPAQVAAPMPAAAPQGIDQVASQGFGQGATNLNVGMPGGIQGPGINLTPATTGTASPYSLTSLPTDAFNMQTGAEGLGGINGAPVGTSPSALERGFGKVMDWAEKNPLTALYAASTTANALMQPSDKEPEKKPSSLSKYKLSPNFQGSFPTANVYKPQYQSYRTAKEGGVMQSFAQGGIAALAQGGYPMSQQDNTQFATPSQMPASAEVIGADYEPAVNPYSGEPVKMAAGGMTGKGGGNAGTGTGAMYGKGGGGGGGTRDPLANFVRAPDIVPNPYKAEYIPETTGPVGPPSNLPILNFAAKWGGAQNLLDTYAPNLTPTILSQMAPAEAGPAMAAPTAPMAAPAAPAASAPGYKGGGIPGPGIDVGINNVRDEDFQFDNPYKTAASKLDNLYKKTSVPQKAMATAPALGAIDLTPAMMKKAAQGGIMGSDSSLGGYAAGGNARLLRGPGDGMSDDIPATIANKQPARLADGEFVIPADVVSHLGNGSTEAGAKHLHGMMDKVRTARTGRKAQGKQINPKKFMPK